MSVLNANVSPYRMGLSKANVSLYGISLLTFFHFAFHCLFVVYRFFLLTARETWKVVHIRR